ncbi:MAG: hypothetical protein KDB53_18820 [Planctomycetes bacterium]|nr:hypothetical protein [Planctomycetota bacterium]
MKTFLSFIGILTLAQWLFIGLLYGFLTLQDKKSPETLSRLHDTPVVGGYFPAVDVRTDEDREREKESDRLRRIVEAKKYYELPIAFDENELTGLIEEIRAGKAEVERQRRDLEERREEIMQLVSDFERREEQLVERQKGMEKIAIDLKITEDELTFKTRVAEGEVDRIEAENLKRIALWMNGMDPAQAAKRLLPDEVKGESREQRQLRYLDAAKLLSRMDPEVASQVIAEIDPLDWLEIEKEKRNLPLDKK